jgi:predicted ester cyclase
MTAPQENTILVRRVFDSLTKLDVTAAKEHIAPELFARVAEQAKSIRTAFPDLKMTVEDVISEGDRVVTRWTASGTHSGEGTLPQFGEVKPTGKKVTIHGITINRVRGGKIVETWGATEKLEAMMQLGIVGPGDRERREPGK